MDRLLDIRNDILRWQDTSGRPLPNGICPCLICTKPFLMPPYIGEPDQVCPECFTTYKDTAKVICRKCQVTIGRLVPKVLDNGFYIKPRAVLHSNRCNCCCPGLTESTVMEIDEWQRSMRPGRLITTGR